MTDNPVIVYKIASRGKKEKFFKTIDSIYAKAKHENFYIIASLENNDPEMQTQDVKAKFGEYKKLCPWFGESNKIVDAINRDIFIVFDILICMSEDTDVLVEGFDLKIINDFKSKFPDGNGVLHYPDFQDPAFTTTMSTPVMGRKYYDRFGYIYYPEYNSIWCTNEATEVAKLLKCYEFINLQLFCRNDHIPLFTAYNEAVLNGDKMLFENRRNKAFDLVKIVHAADDIEFVVTQAEADKITHIEGQKEMSEILTERRSDMNFFNEGFEVACKMLDEYDAVSHHPYRLADCLRVKRNLIKMEEMRVNENHKKIIDFVNNQVQSTNSLYAHIVGNFAAVDDISMEFHEMPNDVEKMTQKGQSSIYQPQEPKFEMNFFSKEGIIEEAKEKNEVDSSQTSAGLTIQNICTTHIGNGMSGTVSNNPIKTTSGTVNIFSSNNNDINAFPWGITERINVEEYSDRIEFIYKQTSIMHIGGYPGRPPQQRVYKIVFSVVDGKWHKSDPIFGKIVPAQEEVYEFDEE